MRFTGSLLFPVVPHVMILFSGFISTLLCNLVHLTPESSCDIVISRDANIVNAAEQIS